MKLILEYIKKILNFIGIKQPYILYKINKGWPFFLRDDKFTLTLWNTFLWLIDNEYKIQSLKKWFDKESIELIDEIARRIKLCSKYNLIKENELFSINNFNDRKLIQKFFKRNEYKLPIKKLEASVFFYKQWINEVPNINSFLKNKDILDCWWYIWDSSLLFSQELNSNKIYCFEPEEDNYKLLIKTIKMNKLKNKIIPVKYWVSNHEWKIHLNWKWLVATKIDKTKKWVKYNTINITTIDKYVFKNNITPWLIKWDIEWQELESVKWAEKTIKKFKPKLIIAVYHTWKDFFEIKPLIESWNLWYKFKLKHMEPNHPRFETFLICY